MLTNMDKLYESVAANGPVCVGLDTEIGYLPATDAAKTAGENVVEFNRALINATKGVAGCYKVQIAYYESLGLDGMRAYAETLKLARATGLPVIADIKRGDIAKTAEMYAKAHLPATLRRTSSRWHPIWVLTPSARICRTGPSRARACLCGAAPPTPAPRTLSTKSSMTAAMFTTSSATA